MSNINFPITKLDGNKFQVVAYLDIYSKEAINATCYKYSGGFYIHQEINGSSIVVIFETKDGKEIQEETIKQFCTDLIDQQLRVDINKRVGHIRDLIVEEAFKPVNK